MKANAKNVRIPFPKPMRRPGEPEPEKPMPTTADVARFFGRNVQYTNGGEPACR